MRVLTRDVAPPVAGEAPNRGGRDILHWDRPAGKGAAPLSEAQRHCERALFVCLLAVRVLHLVQAGDTAATAWDSYRHPLLDVALIVAAVVESVWALSRFWRRRAIDDASAAIVDIVFGVVALVAMTALTTTADRSAWINWACPFTYGTVAISFMVFRRRAGAAVTALFALTYLATVLGSFKAGGSLLATALANTVTYAGVYLAGGAMITLLRRAARDVDAARAQAVERGGRLVAERERNRHHRLLHDAALQTLEAVANAGDGASDVLRRQARVDATRLRQVLRGEDSDAGSLVDGLHHLAIEFAAHNLHVEVVSDTQGADVAPATAAALHDATREALTNVRKHAGVSSVVVAARELGADVEVVIRDHGCGFSPSETDMGFGLNQSIHTRMSEVAGTASLWSRPGRGTRVVLRAPG